jgi:hypothetical protein
MLMSLKIAWYGNDVIQDIIGAFSGGVDETIKKVYSDSQKSCPVETGKLKRSGKILPAKDGGDDIYGRVIYTADYAIYPELDKQFLRKALIRNEKGSLENFEGKLK